MTPLSVGTGSEKLHSGGDICRLRRKPRPGVRAGPSGWFRLCWRQQMRVTWYVLKELTRSSLVSGQCQGPGDEWRCT